MAGEANIRRCTNASQHALRLQRVLPADLLAKTGDLTVPQLIALRFAGDEELPALCREVLAGTCTAPKAIKARIQHWQADYLRA